jgi:dTDP-4-amino-4,6-dideoxygalactose transaminase
MINVTKTFLPPQAEYQSILSRAWATGWMTNRGVLVQELEAQLTSYLGVQNIICMTNGTLPLQIAIKALGLTGEIITTPFSYVATTAAIVWEGCTPVFVDIHPEYLTIDETKIEAAITEKTTAILATHVYGNPCNVDAIDDIAKKHNLKVIYDAAHCFGVQYKGRSIFNYGDVSTCSFHATKLFHTGEGGALFCKPEYYNKMYQYHNFGHDGPEAFHGLGINAKMSEPQAAMGLAVLPYVADMIESRQSIVETYNDYINKNMVFNLKLRINTNWNYSYYPIIFNSEDSLKSSVVNLQSQDIFPRRYFFPSLNTLPYVKKNNTPVASSISSRILCLPLWSYMDKDTAKHISNLL